MEQLALKVIGISGKKYHGKNQLAEAIGARAEARPNVYFRCRALADALKEECAEALSPYLLSSPRFQPLDREQIRVHLLETFLGEHGGPAKEQHRLFLQYWGTEFRRSYFGETYWTDQLHKWITATHMALTRFGFRGELVVAVPDVRFPDEIDTILDLGGRIVRIQRPDFPAQADAHISETALDDYPFEHVVVNRDGPDWREHLESEAESLLDQLLTPEMALCPR